MKRKPLKQLRLEPLETRIAPAFGGSFNLNGLNGFNGFEIHSEPGGDRFGDSVNSAGDMNGDGIDDIVVGADLASFNEANSGAAYVIFGRTGGFPNPLDLETLDGTNGFRLNGQIFFGFAGAAVCAGDINGDGFDDLMVSAPRTTVDAGEFGTTYVVFGKATPYLPAVELANLNGTDGFKIIGKGALARSGFGLSTGDVNGDNLDDMIISAEGSFAFSSGAAYVVFGKTTAFGAVLNASTLNGTNGFIVEMPEHNAGRAVSSGGDINGDGFDDVVIGWDLGERIDGVTTRAGATYVVFGKAGGFNAKISAAALNGSDGFKIVGALNGDYSGNEVSFGGDLNGDGIDDLIIGAYKADRNGVDSGAVYVVYGSKAGFAASMNLANLNGTNGFQIRGAKAGDFFGNSISGVGDINKDGVDDFVIGAEFTSPHGKSSGTAYVIYGKATGFPAIFEVSTMQRADGFKIEGRFAADALGHAVRGAGDFNGDGIADLIIGSTGAGANGVDVPYYGAAYILFGVAAGPNVTPVALPDLALTSPGKVANIQVLANDSDEDGGTLTVTSVGVPLHGTASVGAGGIVLYTPAANFLGRDFFTYSISDGNGGETFNTVTVDVKRDVSFLIAKKGKQATYVDVDGDLVTVKTTKGAFIADDFAFDYEGRLTELELTRANGGFAGTKITVTAKAPKKSAANGLVEIGALDASGIDLNGVSIKGGLGSILAGDSLRSTPAIKSLTVNSLGAASATAPLKSAFVGAVGTLNIKGAMENVNIFITGASNPAKASKAVALKALTVGGDLKNSFIGVGYTTTGVGNNADVSMGNVLVKGNWAASSLAVGVRDSGEDGIGRNDGTSSGGGDSDKVIAKIASVTIKGTATGSTTANAFFGIAAELISKGKIGKSKLALTKEINDLVLDSVNLNFRALEIER